MTTRKRGRYIERAIQDEITSKALDKWTPIQIYEYLEKKVKAKELEGALPSQRTVQRIVADVTIRDTSGIWTLGDSEGEDARLILDVLAHVILLTEGRRRNITKAEAGCVLKVRKAAPDMDVRVAWRLAQLYLLYESKGASPEPLDTYLALTPWRSDKHHIEYIKANVRGWITDVVPAWAIRLYEEALGPDELHQLAELEQEEDRMLEEEFADHWRSLIMRHVPIEEYQDELTKLFTRVFEGGDRVHKKWMQLRKEQSETEGAKGIGAVETAWLRQRWADRLRRLLDKWEQ